MSNNEQEKLSKEFDAWRKLEDKLLSTQSKLRFQKIRATAARKACTRAIRGFWNTIYQIQNIESSDLDRQPVSPYRVNPVTGEPRNLEDPEDTLPERLGIVIVNYESSENKVLKLIQELTEDDKPGHSAPHN